MTTIEMIRAARMYLQPRKPDDTTGDVVGVRFGGK